MVRNTGVGDVKVQRDSAGSISFSGQNLIFLISQPRAGSTLLQKILGAHPAIHTLSEPWIALHPLFGLREEGLATDYNSMLARTALKEFLGRLPEGEEAYWQAVRGMLGELYGRALKESGKALFLDKTPRYYFIIPELRHVFPDARVVFLLRNPLAVLTSILSTWVKSDDPLQLRPFRHDLMTAPRLLLEGIRSCGPSAIVIRYEDVVSKPAKEIRRLCASLEIAFQPGMVEYGTAAGGERWLYGDQDTVYQESRPVREFATRWRSVLTRSPVWEAWARSYLEALGPDVVGELGYDYAQLSTEVAVPPAPADWQMITESDAESHARVRSQLEHTTATVIQKEQAAAMFEAVAAERLAELGLKDAALAEITAQAKWTQEELERAVRGIEDREQRIATLQATAEERLAAMENRDREIAARDERITALESAAAERLRAMQDRDAEIAARDERLASLEAAAAERLEAVQDRDREIAARDERIAGLESVAAERLAAMQDRDREIAARDERLASLEAAAAERLAAMQDRDREIAVRDERLAVLESVAAERLAAMQERDREIAVRDEWLATLEAAAAERLAAMQDRDREIAARDERLTTLETAAAERSAMVQEISRDIQARNEQIAKLEAVDVGRLAAMRGKEQEIARLKSELATLHAELESTTAAAAEQQEQAAALNREFLHLKEQSAQLAAKRRDLLAEREALFRRLHEFEQERLRDYLTRRYRQRRSTPSKN